MGIKKRLSAEQDDALSCLPGKLSISDEDIYEAMKEIQGYIDITASDFKELYQISYCHVINRLTRSIRAADIMNPNVITVSVSTPLHDVASTMADACISGVPVQDKEGKIKGVVTEQDFLKHMGARNKSFMSIVASCLKGKGCAAVSVRKAVAADIMNQPAITISEDATLAEIASIMSKQAINRLPVVGANKDLITGILTRADLVRTHLI